MKLAKTLLALSVAVLIFSTASFAEDMNGNKHADSMHNAGMHADAKFDSSDINEFKNCKYCGMDREKFAHSRMYVEYDDGSKLGTCSLHCLAVDFANNIDKTPKSIMVGDYNSKKLIDAEKSYWVIGGKLQGVMSQRAKWAFEKKSEAESFISKNGGKLVKFEDAIKGAYEDMYKDTKMIREKRKMKRSKAGHTAR